MSLDGCCIDFAPVAQLAEATDSKPVQCAFESHQGHKIKTRFHLMFYEVGAGFSMFSLCTYSRDAALIAAAPHLWSTGFAIVV